MSLSDEMRVKIGGLREQALAREDPLLVEILNILAEVAAYQTFSPISPKVW